MSTFDIDGFLSNLNQDYDLKRDLDFNQACVQGNLERAKELYAQGVRIDEPLGGDWTALFGAVYNDHHEVADWLLEIGASPLVGNSFDYNPLHIMAERGYEDLLIKALNNQMFNPEGNCLTQKEQGLTHFAAQANQLKILAILHESDFSFNEPDSKGDTPLHLAAQKELPDVVNFLIDVCGVTEMRKNKAGKTPGEMTENLVIKAKLEALAMKNEISKPQSTNEENSGSQPTTITPAPARRKILKA